MTADELSGASEARGWRKRHPVLSRALLYGLGVAALVVVVILLNRRRDADRQDHFEYLTARLEALDMVLAVPGSEAQVLEILDAEFSDPDLPPALRNRRLRVEAQVRARLEEWETALALIDEADRIEVDAVAREGARIERAEVLAQAGRLPEALELIRPAMPPGVPHALRVIHALELAYVLNALDRRDEGRRIVEEALQALPRPLPEEEPVPVGASLQSGPIVVVTATRQLEAMSAGAPDPEPWRRLLALAPDTFPATAYAALGLLTSGRDEEARRAWGRAEALNPSQAAMFRARHPALADLQDSLKSDDGFGR